MSVYQQLAEYYHPQSITPYYKCSYGHISTNKVGKGTFKKPYQCQQCKKSNRKGEQICNIK